MINPKEFISCIAKTGINTITGVPDSLLKDLTAAIDSYWPSEKHIISTNEGSALALAIGSYMATKKVPMVYLQNSGIGNIINPITSLADTLVYSIPILLIIGWRGEVDHEGQQINDEPQHKKQGIITLKQLELLDIPYIIIEKNTLDYAKKITEIFNQCIDKNRPVALVIRKGTFKKHQKINTKGIENLPSRESVINQILNTFGDNNPIISTTGFTSRELYELRKTRNEAHSKDFLTVGGMGHASQIACGIAKFRGEEKVVCIDGDGGLLMHTGSLAISAECDNLIHFVINNGVHDSVGGQPTKGNKLKLFKIAKEFGYKNCFRIESLQELEKNCNYINQSKGSTFIEIMCKVYTRSNLGRPENKPIENKLEFIKFLNS